MRRICLIIPNIIGILILIIIVKLCNPGISSWVRILVVYPHLRSKVHLIHVHQAQFVYTMYHKCTLSNISPQFIIVFSHTLVSNLLRIHPVYSCSLYHILNRSDKLPYTTRSLLHGTPCNKYYYGI